MHVMCVNCVIHHNNTIITMKTVIHIGFVYFVENSDRKVNITFCAYKHKGQHKYLHNIL